MKKLILLVLIPTVLFAGEAKRDPLFPDRFNLDDGSYIKRDPLFENRWNQYDREGNKTGTWRRDHLFENRWRFEKESNDTDDCKEVTDQ